ncbi:hypothetical protein M0R04_14670 [Candidatus Dojkabacteria bacterium]|nr:hypothetical protein [Candidatus Dojkabacteria bacterium]
MTNGERDSEDCPQTKPVMDALPNKRLIDKGLDKTGDNHSPRLRVGGRNPKTETTPTGDNHTSHRPPSVSDSTAKSCPNRLKGIHSQVHLQTSGAESGDVSCTGQTITHPKTTSTPDTQIKEEAK